MTDTAPTTQTQTRAALERSLKAFLADAAVPRGSGQDEVRRVPPRRPRVPERA